MDTLIDLAQYMTGAQDEPSYRGTSDKILYMDQHLPWLADCQSILDLGCGAGSIVNQLRDQGFAAGGVTYNDQEVKFAKDRFDIDLVYADLHKLPLDNSSYDGGIMWDVIEHTLAPPIVLSEARRVLRKKLLVFIPGEYWQHCRYHYICLTPSQMIHLCNRTGWKVVDVVTYYDSNIPTRHGHNMLSSNVAYRLEAV